ncbi:MAG: hypothetical protein QOH89_1455 [Pseudonocardiales bacterium]|nr:hypothetical protein [Pseudonocardiales bacterium]
MLVSGEPGSGKSALAGACVAEAANRARVISAVCHDTVTPVQLSVLHDAARELGGGLAEGVAQDLAKHHLFDLTLGQIGRSLRPVIWVIDDAQWADEASLDFVRFVVRRMAGLPLLMVVTYRDTEVHPSLRSLLGELATVPAVRRVVVPSLSTAAVGALASDLNPGAVARLHARTGGNAFFVTELLREAESPGGGVADVILGRIERLPGPARGLVEALAVVGGPCPVEFLPEVGESLDHLDELVRAGLVVTREAGQIGFRHDLVREAVLASLPAPRRVTLHRLALRALGDDVDPAVAVEHAIGAGDRAATARWALAAADRSAAMGSNRDTARLLGLAAAATNNDDDKVRALTRQAAALIETGGSAEASAVFEAAAHLQGGPGPRAEMWAMRARFHGLRLEGEESERYLRHALAAAEDEPVETRPLLPYAVAAMQQMWRRDAEAARRYGAIAVGIAERRGDWAAAADVRVTVGHAVALGDPSLRELRAATEDAERLGAHRTQLRGLFNIANALMTHGRLAEALETMDRVVVLCADRDYDDMLLSMQAMRYSILFDMGDYRSAVDAAQLLDDERYSMRIGMSGVLSLGLARTGRLQDRTLIENEPWLASTTSDVLAQSLIRATAAELAWLTGDATRQLDELAAMYPTLHDGHQILRDFVAGWSALLGGRPLPASTADLPYALAGNGRFAAAAAGFVAAGMPYHQALALYRIDEPETLLEACDVAQRIGALPLADKVRTALRRHGVDAPRRRGTGRVAMTNPVGLTSREMEVLHLVAEGLRNADIAGRLVLSPRTVDHHVSSVLNKLGVRSRAAAGRAALALGVIAPV